MMYMTVQSSSEIIYWKFLLTSNKIDFFLLLFHDQLRHYVRVKGKHFMSW